MTRSRLLLILVPACLLAGLVALGLRSSDQALEPPPPYSFSDGLLVLSPGSKLLGRLEIIEIGKASEETAEFRAVGQIIALSNASGSLTGERTGWVELDPQLSAAADLKLGGNPPAGTAYGLTNLAPEYASRLEPGQSLEIRRYGLKRTGVSGVVAKVLPRPGNGSDVVFRFSNAQDWFPGTNCEVAFPVLRGHPVRIPTTAPVHAGTQEYVWKEVAPGRFAVQNISLIDATPAEVFVLGLNPGDRIVGRGAILLKPLLKPLLKAG